MVGQLSGGARHHVAIHVLEALDGRDQAYEYSMVVWAARPAWQFRGPVRQDSLYHRRVRRSGRGRLHSGELDRYRDYGRDQFIERQLIARLSREPHRLHALSRRYEHGRLFGVDLEQDRDDRGSAAGEPGQRGCLMSTSGRRAVLKRWTPEVKTKIRESRRLGTERLVRAIGAQRRKPSVLVCASALSIFSVLAGR